MADLGDVDTYRVAGITYMRAGNWASALIEFLAAKAIIATSPDARRTNSELRHRGTELDSLIDICQKKADASTANTATDAAGMKVTKITWKAVT